MELNDLLAREGIRLTVSIYNSAVDRGDYPDLVKVFAEDSEMIISDDKRIAGGRYAIAKALGEGAASRGAYEPGNFQRHILGNSIINLTGPDTARSVHYIVVITEKGVDHSGVYIDDFQREGSRWWIKTRRANLEWARPDSRFFIYPGKSYITPRDALNLNFFSA